MSKKQNRVKFPPEEEEEDPEGKEKLEKVTLGSIASKP